MYMCLCSCSKMCVCIWIHVEVRDQHRVFFNHFSILIFEMSLIELRAHQSAVLTSQWSPVTMYFQLSISGVTNLVWELRSSCLLRKHFTYWAISSAPVIWVLVIAFQSAEWLTHWLCFYSTWVQFQHYIWINVYLDVL